MSAGTIEPSSKYIISPGTNRFAEIVLSSPSLRTHAEMSYLTFLYKVEAMDYIIKDNYKNISKRMNV